MGGSSGGGKTEQEPWKKQQPFLEDIFDQAQRIYDQSQARGPWQGNFIAPDDPRTTAARDAWYETNRMNTGYLNDTMNFMNGRMGAPAQQGQDWLNSAVNTTDRYRAAGQFTRNNLNRDFQGEITPFSNEQFGGLDPSGSLFKTLNGEFQDPNNPLMQNYLKALERPFDERLNDQIGQYNSKAIASGAYGGTANAKLAGRAIGDTNQAIADTRANVLYNNLQAERERQQNVGLNERGIEAQNFAQRQNLLQQDRNMQLNGLLQQFAQNSNNIFANAGMEQGRNQMLAGMGGEAINRGMQAGSMMPSLFQGAQLPYQNMSQIGDMFTNSDQRTLQNAMQMWQNPMDFAWGNLGNYQGMVNGNYGFTGNQGGGGSPLMGAVGGGTLGALAGSGLAGAGMTMGLGAAAPWALPLILGAGGAGLGGLFG